MLEIKKLEDPLKEFKENKYIDDDSFKRYIIWWIIYDMNKNVENIFDLSEKDDDDIPNKFSLFSRLLI